MVNQVQMQRFNKQVQDKTLLAVDLNVAMYLASYIDITNGCIERRPTDICRDLGISDGRVYQSLKRLRANDWLVKGLKGAGYFFMLDPWTWTVGKKEVQPKRRGLFKKLQND